MPALMDDPLSAPIPSPPLRLPFRINPRLVTLRNGQTATILPFGTPASVPYPLLSHLSATFNAEIETGNSYPLETGIPLGDFGDFWVQNFAAIMLLGDFTAIYPADLISFFDSEAASVEDLCLGTFYIKPNYPGRSSHICNGGFLVPTQHRGKGVGRLLGEAYLHYAPRLGYEYSVFNLVFETNTASMRIWDALGFERIGRVPGAGRLRSFAHRVDAIVYGRELRCDDGGGNGDEMGELMVGGS